MFIRSRVRGVLFATVAIGTLSLAAPATALAEAAPDAAPTADPAATPDTTPDPQLGEIVVTATRRETSLQKTPIAINVIGADDIKQRHVQSLLDLGDGTVPSLRVATFEARQSALTVGIRGIVPFDQNQTARDTGVGVYIDGVYLGRSQGLNAALFDVERIEVLKGPQGTLFGRNTEGGALNIVTAQPTGVFGGRLSAGVGNYGSHTVQGHLNLPEFANIAIKIDGVQEHQDPTVKNPLAGQAGWNFYNREGGRISAKWSPTSNFSATVAYDKAKDENTPNFSQLISYNPLGKTVGQYDPVTLKLVAPGSPAGTATVCTACIAPLSPLIQPTGGDRQKSAVVGVPQQPSIDRTEGVSTTLKYAVAPALELRSITAWRRVSTEQWDNSGGPARTIFAPNTNFSRYSLSFLRQHQFSQEFQAVGSIPQLDYTAGLYYFNEYAQEQAATPSSNKWNANGTDYTINSETVTGPVTSSNQGWAIGDQFLQRASYARAKSYAAYGQLTYTPDSFDLFHLTLGGRYTDDKRNGRLYIVSGVATPYTLDLEYKRFDPLAVAAFDLSQTVHVYAKYATGYRAGGANDRSATFLAFGPESVKSYEVGAKMDLLDHRVRLNLAGYIMDRKGTQTDFDNVDTNPYLPGTTTPNPTFNLHTENTANAPGTSKIRGAEADLTVRATDNITLGASYAYTYTKVPPTPNPNLGNVLYQVYTVYTPRNAASGYVDYSVPVSGNGTALRAHLDAAYADPQYSFQNEATRTDRSFVVNGRLALADIPVTASGTKMTLSLWSRNLLNTTYIYRRSNANDAVLGDYGNFNPPRTFGAEIGVAF
ncbi:TonB-dependent receptor [Sphingomonas sp. EC-HK361]|uniref:TonB-dependent receptor n=1 Tax=Sphingomonas sp. EC-HK361 TaxID=2038397 RepID=UPI00125829FA|nr:TonB-dependent receptor [Sphingomonas sp. EC-HK361]VVT15192.1 TonB-dependent receptor [Sphingomonas sp. EC-HK361]